MSSVSRPGSSLSRRGGQRTGENPNSDCGLAVAQGVVLATGQGKQRGAPVRFAVFAAEGIAGFAVAYPAQRVSTLLEWRTVDRADLRQLWQRRALASGWPLLTAAPRAA